MSALPGWPRLMKAKLASAYLDLSQTKFLELVRDGLIAAGKQCGGNVLWDIRDLDEYADSLPQRGKLVSMDRKAKVL